MRVNIEANHTMASEVLKQIEDQTDYLFVYNKNVNLNNRVTVNAKDETVADVLDQMFKGTNIVYAMEGNNILLMNQESGNQQKGIIGREILSNPDLLIAVQPTRGLDVGSIEYIHKRLVEQRDNGKAVLLVSLELDEVLNVSDRIAIVNNGELVGIVNTSETDENEVGLMMAGIKKGES